MPTDPTPTQTPAINVFGGPMKHLTAMSHEEMRCELAEYRRLAALAATGDAPLPPRTACPECGEGCPGWWDSGDGQVKCRACDEYEQIRTAYTALAAQIAAVLAQTAQHARAMAEVTEENQGLRAERDALREAGDRYEQALKRIASALKGYWAAQIAQEALDAVKT